MLLGSTTFSFSKQLGLVFGDLFHLFPPMSFTWSVEVRLEYFGFQKVLDITNLVLVSKTMVLYSQKNCFFCFRNSARDLSTMHGARACQLLTRTTALGS